MPETPGENFIFIILSVIFMIFIIVIFASFLFLGVGFSNATTCYASSQVSNFFYNDLCFSNFFCLSSTLQSYGINPPDFGCTTSSQTFSSGASTPSVFSGVATALSECWDQYGGSQGLTVSPGATRICSIISLDLNQNITFGNLTTYLQNTPFTTEVSCLNHTAAQACADPFSSSNPNGFSCNFNNPSECISNNSDFFSCFDQPGYTSFTQGYSLTVVPLYSSTAPNTAYNDLPQYLCSASEGCSFNTSVGTCTNQDGATTGCSTPYTDFCAKNQSGDYVCSIGYDSVLNSYEVPNTCQITEPVKPTSVVNVSYFNYLRPGFTVNYSYKNKTSGSANAVPIDSNKSISKAQLYIVYLNSLVGTRFPPDKVTLPSECVQTSFVVNYPTSGIEYECSRAVTTYALLTRGLPSASLSFGSIAGAAASGIVIGASSAGCKTNTFCNNYVLSNIPNLVGTTLFKTSGLEQCAGSIVGWFQQNLHVDSAAYLGMNQMYLCAVAA